MAEHGRYGRVDLDPDNRRDDVIVAVQKVDSRHDHIWRKDQLDRDAIRIFRNR
mgnify:CR=1 FL=1